MAIPYPSNFDMINRTISSTKKGLVVLNLSIHWSSFRFLSNSNCKYTCYITLLTTLLTRLFTNLLFRVSIIFNEVVSHHYSVPITILLTCNISTLKRKQSHQIKVFEYLRKHGPFLNLCVLYPGGDPSHYLFICHVWVPHEMGTGVENPLSQFW